MPRLPRRTGRAADPLGPRIAAEQVRAHYAQLPAMAIAPTLGGWFSAWVLRGSVDNRFLLLGMSAVTALSATRLLLYLLYFRQPAGQDRSARWRLFAVAGALLSGCFWGSAAPLLYPPDQPGDEVFLLVLLTPLPIVPIAALAVYMPAFYAYFIPCALPFIATLALRDNRPEQLAALLLLMMMAAMMTFARLYSKRFAEAIRLRLQLADQSAALEAAVAYKARFIAAASHDLRQPVHAMGLFLASVLPAAGAEHRGLLEFLDMSLRNLRGLLNNMLDTSRLDDAVLSPRLQDFDIGPLLGRLADEFLPIAERAGLRLRSRTPTLWVLSDAALLDRILRNLLANAVKFTRRGGVSLVALNRGDRVLLQVRDTGVGIARDQIEPVFHEYRQLGDRDEGEAGGMGLGLAIVRRLADLLGHDLRVYSRPGRGTVFTLALPRGAPAGGFDPGCGAAQVPRTMPRSVVLLVDDDPTVRESLSALIRSWGHETIACGSAAQALAMLADAPRLPALLVVDYRLAAGHTGAAAGLQRWSALEVPVILITADTSVERLREAVARGHVLLHKPVDPLRLQACMADVLATRGRVGERSA